MYFSIRVFEEYHAWVGRDLIIQTWRDRGAGYPQIDTDDRLLFPPMHTRRTKHVWQRLPGRTVWGGKVDRSMKTIIESDNELFVYDEEG